MSPDDRPNGPSSGVNQQPTPEPRCHSMVCCCVLCEQYGTGEQAMRSAQGDYGQFLASLRSAALPTAETTPAATTEGRKPSRPGATSWDTDHDTKTRHVTAHMNYQACEPICHAAQAETAGAARRAQQSPRRQAEGDLGPQPGTFTPFEALQIVQAEWAANGPVFAEPLEEVLAELGQKPEPDARQARLLAFIDSCEPRVEELLNQAVQAGADPEDLIALLSDGTVLPPYTNLVPRAEVAAEVAILLGQVDEPLLHNEWARPTPGILLALVLFEGVQAVSVFPYSVHRDLGAQA